jgi:hypothetical protein
MPSLSRARAETPHSDRRQTIHYIHDLLRSLEAIASTNELPVLSRLIGMAKAEALSARDGMSK